MDIIKIINHEAKDFLEQFLRDRKINKEFYKRVPEDKLDFRITDKSDSIRKSIIHQVDTTRDYNNGVKTGILNFKVEYSDLKDLEHASKEVLLEKLEESEEELIEVLSDSKINERTVKVPWSEKPIPAISSLWGLDSHEVLHQGWNLALMDILDIERFKELKKMWG